MERTYSATERYGISKSLSEEAIHCLYNLQLNGILCDGILRTQDGGSFPVHRAIMVVCSPYFQALFTSTIHRENRHAITIPDVSKDILKIIIEYAYTRQVPITRDNACDIIVSADQFGVERLVETCCRFVIDNFLSPSNCIGILQFARSYFIRTLEAAAHKYLMQHFEQVAMDDEELMELPVDSLAEILGYDELNIQNEELAWNVVLRWIDKDFRRRKRHVCSLIKQIRLGLLDAEYFIQKVKGHPYVQESEHCRPLIIDALKFLYDLNSMLTKETKMDTPALARPRIPHEIMFVIGGWSGGTPTSFVESYDTRADRWIVVHQVDPSGPRAYHGCIIINSDIYVIGGFDGIEYFNSCRCFNAVSKEWREISPMHARRCYVSVAVVQDTIYAMGGYDGHIRQNTAEKYDYHTNQWTSIAPMNIQRSDANATALEDKVYIVGGFNGLECLSSCEVYDPETNVWSMIAPMRSRRSGVSCVAYHGCVYAVGGFNGITRLRSGEKYNPQSNTWVAIPDMYSLRSNFAMEVIDDMIFAIGGFNGVTTIYSVECYDEQTNTWYEATDMNLFRSALSACVIAGLPNVHDYIHQNRDELVEDKRQRLLAARRNQNNMPLDQQG